MIDLLPTGVKCVKMTMKKMMEAGVMGVKKALADAGRVTIGMDIWTKKGYTSAYLGISASFFQPTMKKAVHIVLNLHIVEHPHTGAMIASLLQKTLDAWQIPSSKILMIITDNGSNMVRAVKDLKAQQEADMSSEEEDEPVDSMGSEEMEAGEVKIDGSYKRLPCLAHGIQLVVHVLDKIPSYCDPLQKARSVVNRIRMSSVATQKLLCKAGKTIVSDCPTRWSSSFLMVTRLLELKTSINDVFDELKWDSLLTSEWAKLEEIMYLLQPFAEHTNTLQTDVVSLSNVIPVILDLQCHLDAPELNHTMAVSLSAALKKRFSRYLIPADDEFNPLPAAACLLSPDVAKIILKDPNYQSLLHAAKSCILILVCSV